MNDNWLVWGVGEATDDLIREAEAVDDGGDWLRADVGGLETGCNDAWAVVVTADESVVDSATRSDRAVVGYCAWPVSWDDPDLRAKGQAAAIRAAIHNESKTAGEVDALLEIYWVEGFGGEEWKLDPAEGAAGATALVRKTLRWWRERFIDEEVGP